MFTGIVEEVGRVQGARRHTDAMRLDIHAPLVTGELRLGDSVAVNGVCLTACAVNGKNWEADVSGETLSRSNLGRLKPGDRVNLERALRIGDRLGGHLVQGHVDATVAVTGLSREGGEATLAIDLPPAMLRYVVEKGSIALNGVSLTVAALRGSRAEMALVPLTLAETNLAALRPGALVNLEVDILGKYVEKLLNVKSEAGDRAWNEREGIDLQKLAEHGFL